MSVVGSVHHLIHKKLGLIKFVYVSCHVSWHMKWSRCISAHAGPCWPLLSTGWWFSWTNHGGKQAYHIQLETRLASFIANTKRIFISAVGRNGHVSCFLHEWHITECPVKGVHNRVKHVASLWSRVWSQSLDERNSNCCHGYLLAAWQHVSVYFLGDSYSRELRI